MTFKYETSAEFLAEKLLDFEVPWEDNAIVRLAKNPAEFKSAYRLVYREYLKKRYCRPSKSRMHYTFHCFLPDSRTFFLEKSGAFLGTLTLIPDSPCGLPIENVFPEEVQKIRSAESRIAEISLLAIDPSLYKQRELNLLHFRNWSSVFPLFKGMFQYAKQIGITDLIIAVHPDHQKLYQTLAFKTVSSIRPYPMACHNPAVALRLNIRDWMDHAPSDHITKIYFLSDTAMDTENLEPEAEWTADSMREMLSGKLVPATAQQYFETAYPGWEKRP